MGTIKGGEGPDTLTGTNGVDTILGRSGNDNLKGLAGNDQIVGGSGSDSIWGEDGDDTLYGQDINENRFSSIVWDGKQDSIYGGNGNDRINSIGSNYIDGGSGHDFIFEHNGSLTLDFAYNGNPSNIVDTWQQPWWDLFFPEGIAGAYPTIIGGSGNDQIYISNAHLIDCGSGDDRVFASSRMNDDNIIKYDGGEGKDRIVFSSVGTNYQFSMSDTIIEAINQGMAVKTEFGIFANYKIDFSKIFNFEEILLTTSSNAYLLLPSDISANGNSANITITSRAFGNEFNFDTYYIDASHELSADYTIKSILPDDITYTMAVAFIIKGGNGNDSINGNIRDDKLFGGDGDDEINCLDGDDTITGGRGDDYIDGGDGVDVAIYSGMLDKYDIIEITYNTFEIHSKVDPDGTDTIVDVNKLQFSDQTIDVVIRGIELIGDSTSEGLTGSEFADHLDGAGGNDSLDGRDGNDLIDGGGGNDSIYGQDGNDILYSGSGNDFVDGGFGNDLIIGGDGAGDDRYLGGSGVDTIKYTSAKAGIKIDLTSIKNQAQSILSGNKAGIGIDQISGIENIITGDYDDIIIGNSATNLIEAGSGNDTINGGAGVDTMVGGLGNDTYIVDTENDIVSEILNQGTDLVQVAITSTGGTYTLTSNVENGTLTNTVGFNLTGNELNNRLTGNANNNTLNGGAGVDSLIGGAGNDTYVIDTLSDVITEGSNAGTDFVQVAVATTSGTYVLAANVENASLTNNIAFNLTGSNLNNILTGNAAANILSGLVGNDILNGWGGTDTMIGGLGSDSLYGGNDVVRDIFDFNGITETTVGSGRDKIFDFQSGIDLIDLTGIDANTKLSSDQAFLFNSLKPTTAAANSIWYKTLDLDNDKLSDDLILCGDVNGNTTADFEIALFNVSSLKVTDFFL